MDGKLSSRVIEWKRNHGDPMVGSPGISSESRGLPNSCFASPPMTALPLYTLPQASTSRRLSKILSWRVHNSDARKWLSLEEKKRRKKKKKEEGEDDRAGEKRDNLLSANGTEDSFSSDWSLGDLKKKFGEKFARCPQNNL